MDGSPIDARHPGGLKGVIDVKLNIRDLPSHLSNMAPTPARFSSFVKAIQEEEDEFVWETMAELKEEVKESTGLIATRAQKRKREVAEVTDRKKYAREDTVSRREEKKVEAHQPAYRQEPRIANSEAPQEVLQKILDVKVPNIRIRDLLALSGDLRREIIDQTCTQNKVPAVGAALVTLPEIPVEFATPLREVEVMVMGRRRELGLLDEGSEIVIVQEDLCKELGLEVNKKRKMTMQTANGGKEEMQGCMEYLELEVGEVKTYAYVFVVQSAPYRLLLERPWQKGVKLGKIERVDGSVEVEISDPKEEMRRVVVPIRERMGERLKGSMLAVEERSGSKRERFKLNEEPSGSGYGEEAKALFTGVNMGVGTGRRASGATTDVLKTELERNGVEREEAEEWVDTVIGYEIGMASWLEEGSEKTVMDEGGDIQCDEEVILEKSEEETKSGVADW